jgi:hypothetical protein
MKKLLLLLFGCISIFTANAQNGFATYTTNLSISGTLPRQTAFLVDNAGSKWIGFKGVNATVTVGLVKYDNSTWTIFNTMSTPALPTNSVTALAQDNVGNIWIGSPGGLIKYDGTTFSSYSCPAVNCVEAIGNQVYVGTNAGLFRFDGSAFTSYNVAGTTLPSDTVLSIKAETSNIIWLGGKDRLVQFNINAAFTTTSFNNHPVPQTAYSPFGLPLSSGNIHCIEIDSQNNKWLGTNAAGIVKYDGTTFKNANEIYEIYGSSIPVKVYDIETGIQGGIIFRHATGTNSSNYSGLTELAPNGKVYQYFHSISNAILGEYLAKSGSDILISQGGPSIFYSNVNKIMYHQFTPANNVAPIGSVNVNNFKKLDINNVNAAIANRGDMHWDIAGSGNAMYEVPKGSGKNSNFASALWIGGLDNGGQLHGGAQTYRQAGVDFWPGPLDTLTATTNTTVANSYDKIWKVSYTDINNFITAYNTGSLVATEDIMTWPAHGTGNNSRNLAPFVDHNGDGLYNPIDGDYPKIKGDQTLYFIYNDNLATHSTSFTPMGIEVQGMAYAYGCPSTVNGHNELTYTTFYDYKIINRSSISYHDVYVSMFSDADLGYYGDDYIGSDVGDNYGYIYNADANDETVAATTGYGTYIPAQGFNIVKGPLANANDGIDNNNNGVTDEPGEDCKMNKFNYYNNSFAGVPLNTTDPSNGPEYYKYMTGYWKDGTPFTCGGNGYGGTVQTNYVYTADSYTNGVCGATPWFESTVPGDRRMILSSGPFTLNAGQMQEVEYAFVTSFDSSMTGGMAALPKLKSDIQKINTFYNQLSKPNCFSTITGIEEEADRQDDFEIYPNPAKNYFNVRKAVIDGKVERVHYEVEDVWENLFYQAITKKLNSQ